MGVYAKHLREAIDHIRAEEALPSDLAKAVLSLADSAGMPDSFWAGDSRVALARSVLDVPEDGRESHRHLWEP